MKASSARHSAFLFTLASLSAGCGLVHVENGSAPTTAHTAQNAANPPTEKTASANGAAVDAKRPATEIAITATATEPAVLTRAKATGGKSRGVLQGFEYGEGPSFTLKGKPGEELRFLVTGDAKAARVADLTPHGGSITTNAPTKIGPSGEVSIWIGTAKPGADYTVLAWASSAPIAPLFHVTEPAADAPAEQKLLSAHFPYFADAKAELSPELRRRLFLELPQPFFVFAGVRCGNTVTRGRQTTVGEALVAINPSRQLAADGETFRSETNGVRCVAAARPSGKVVPEAPALPEINAASSFGYDKPEDFLRYVADDDPRKAPYLTKKKTTADCYGREWDKRDPHGRAAHYDLVTTSGGKTVKVEDASAPIDRAVRAACKTATFEAERDRFEKAVVTELKAKLAKDFEPIASRMTTLFP